MAPVDELEALLRKLPESSQETASAVKNGGLGGKTKHWMEKWWEKPGKMMKNGGLSWKHDDFSPCLSS